MAEIIPILLLKSTTTALTSGSSTLAYGKPATTTISGVTRFYVGDNNNKAQEIGAAGGFSPLEGGVARASAVTISTSGTTVEIGNVVIPANSNAMVSFTAAILDSSVTPAALSSLSFWIDTTSAGGSLIPCDNGQPIDKNLNFFNTDVDAAMSFSGKFYNTTGSTLTLYLNGSATGTLFSSTTKMYGYIRAVSV